MKIKVIEGNIIDSKTDIIIHQVNCQFVMGSGVAKALRDKYPIIYEAYSGLKNKDNIYINSQNWLGTAQFVKVNNDQYVVNLFGQDHYGYDGKLYTNYNAIKCGLYSVLKEILFGQLEYVKTIAFPWNMGACRGGGDWNIIKGIIEDVFKDTNIEIHYYKLNKG